MTEPRAHYDNAGGGDEGSKRLSGDELDTLETSALRLVEYGIYTISPDTLLSLIREVREARRGGGGIAG